MADHGTIFCKDCLNFREGDRIPFSYGPPERIREKCMATENFKDTHVQPNSLPISTPACINRFNDCVWFDPKDTSSSTDGQGSSSSSSSQIVDMPN